MKTQFLTSVLLCTALGLTLLSCTARKPEVGTGHGWGEATFSVETLIQGQTEALVQEASAGYEGAPFYGFVTSDVTSSLKNVINEKLGTISVNRHMLKTGVPDSQKVTGLRRGHKHYRYVVTGLTPDGRTYGTPVACEIVTEGTFQQKAEITYLGVSGKNHYIGVSGFAGPYDLTILYKASADAYSSDEELLQDIIDNTSPDPVSGDRQFNIGQVNPGEYVLIAYGVDEETDFEGCYNPTLIYAKSTFTVQ